ncbi:uncharacterized protein QC761_123880 [Podospora bellae-mahoneyi]|uniref:Uncharacterized protein n=1 Tax=Podospora bellae-mahoneyi TaxID=2093777 RepID=A0ABR0FTJ6_9PEZI|nr:hypothetical protein QC761_123880 [Podospora bellae-mahoneyi]
MIEIMSSTAPSPPPVSEKTPVRPYYAPLVPSPLNPKNCFQISPPTSPPGSPSPRTPPPKRPSIRRPASQTSPTQILLRQKAAAAFRSEILIKAYSSNNNNNYISLGSSRRHASSRNPFLNMTQHQNLTTADTIDILYSLDIDDHDDTNPTGDLGLITPGNNTSNKPLPPVPMPPPLFSSSSPGQDPNSDSPPEREDHRLQKKDDLDLLSSTPYHEDYDYDHRDKEEIDLENGCYFERERATLPSGRTASFDDSGGRGRSTLGKARRGGGSGAEHRSGVTRLVIHLGRGLVILGIVIWFVLLHGLLRTFGGARRPPPPDSSLGSASDLEA